MELNDFTSKQQIYLDSSIFIDHHSEDSEYRNSCTEFLRSVEEGKVNGHFQVCLNDQESDPYP